MYYIIRFIFIIVTFSLFLFVLFKSKKIVFFSKNKNVELYQKYKTDKRYKRAYFLTCFMYVAVLILIIFISGFPFEGYFVTFDSVSESLSYKKINTENIIVYEYEDCVFAVDDNDNKIYSITKAGEKYKLVDFSSENIEYNQPIRNGKLGTSNPRKGKYNKETNKTFYYIGINGKEKPDDGVVTLDGNAMTFCKKSEDDAPIKSLRGPCWIYSYTENSTPKTKFVINTGECEVLIQDR